MLNKETCKQCWKIYMESEYKWSVDDEESWNNGKVICVERYKLEVGYFNSAIDRNNFHPDCPYKLEHILRNDEKEHKVE